MEHNIKKKIALVAGGAGFIGSHLCDRLIKDDYRVICLDNLYTGRIENIAHHFNDPNFEFINQDVVEPIKINNLSVILFLLIILDKDVITSKSLLSPSKARAFAKTS